MSASGSVKLHTTKDGAQAVVDIAINKQDDVPAMRGIAANKVGLVFVDLETPEDFDLAARSLRIARECRGFPPDYLTTREEWAEAIHKAKHEWAKSRGTFPTTLIISHLAARDILKWSDAEDQDGNRVVGDLFGLRTVVSVHLARKPGFIVC